MPEDENQYLKASPRTKEQMREQLALATFFVTGSPASVCVHCGAPFTEAKNARRHMATSKKCLRARAENQTINKS